MRRGPAYALVDQGAGRGDMRRAKPPPPSRPKHRTPEQAAVDRMLDGIDRAFDRAIARAERLERAGPNIVDLITRRRPAKQTRTDGDGLA